MTIWQEAQGLHEETIACRRDLHKHPEPAWTEFRTASIVIKQLKRLGFAVLYGSEVIDEASQMGVPSAVELVRCAQRAMDEGAEEALVRNMAGGKTGVVGMLQTGRPGKTVAFRFDMDSNDVIESDSKDHRPVAEGFASVHQNAMHACGHDGHVTIGLALAKLLAAHKEELAGTIKLIFQPGEEGVRGAYAMMKAGVVDDVDYFFSGHVGFTANRDDLFVALTKGVLATTKLDAVFQGVSAHAGAAPQEGKNALLAAAQAAISLSTIARHGKGASRINVGVLNAGTGRNVVPDIATMKLETRGETTEINDYMEREARRMLQAAADLYDVSLEVTVTGMAPSIVPDVELGREVAALAHEKSGYGEIMDEMTINCSEDCTHFMRRVQELGGRALFLMYGSGLAAGHHNRRFDFNEDCLWKAAAMLTEIAIHFSNK